MFVSLSISGNFCLDPLEPLEPEVSCLRRRPKRYACAACYGQTWEEFMRVLVLHNESMMGLSENWDMIQDMTLKWQFNAVNYYEASDFGAYFQTYSYVLTASKCRPWVFKATAESWIPLRSKHLKSHLWPVKVICGIISWYMLYITN